MSEASASESMSRHQDRREQVVVWAGRVLWAAVPLTLGPALGRVLHDWSTTARTSASVYAWGLWAAVLVATLVPHPVAMTAWRAVAPASAVIAAWVAIDGHASIAGAVVAVLATAAAFAPETGAHFVNGPA